MGLLRQGALSFLQNHSPEEEETYQSFCLQEQWWLDDFALFMDIKEYFDLLAAREGKGGAIWSNYWPEDLALREPKAIETWKGQGDHRQTIETRKVIQYFFFTQWKALKKYANDRGIAIIGDLPIFVAVDSVDVWAHRELFQLNEKGIPKRVAGVPPDYFSETGQLWGNPLYDWPKHTEQNYSWWIQRIKGNLRLFDWLRIDHFRGFEAYWSVPYGESTAVHGTWEKAPGHDFFSQLKAQVGDLPILAEDLGFITEEVRKLRDSFSLPGMKILQFAFDAKESGKGLDVLNGFLPHMYTPQSIVYTGTHDNDTLKGWLDKALPQELEFIRSYLGYTPVNYVEALIRLALSSVATFAIIPMQDILGLGSEARMNTPSTIGNNWKWRITENQMTDGDAEFIKILSHLYGRNI
jgi:4-alpha-glucanotransferase